MREQHRRRTAQRAVAAVAIAVSAALTVTLGQDIVTAVQFFSYPANAHSARYSFFFGMPDIGRPSPAELIPFALTPLVLVSVIRIIRYLISERHPHQLRTTLFHLGSWAIGCVAFFVVSLLEVRFHVGLGLSETENVIPLTVSILLLGCAVLWISRVGKKHRAAHFVPSLRFVASILLIALSAGVLLGLTSGLQKLSAAESEPTGAISLTASTDTRDFANATVWMAPTVFLNYSSTIAKFAFGIDPAPGFHPQISLWVTGVPKIQSVGNSCSSVAADVEPSGGRLWERVTCSIEAVTRRRTQGQVTGIPGNPVVLSIDESRPAELPGGPPERVPAAPFLSMISGNTPGSLELHVSLTHFPVSDDAQLNFRGEQRIDLLDTSKLHIRNYVTENLAGITGDAVRGLVSSQAQDAPGIDLGVAFSTDDSGVKFASVSNDVSGIAPSYIGPYVIFYGEPQRAQSSWTASVVATNTASVEILTVLQDVSLILLGGVPLLTLRLPSTGAAAALRS